MRAAGRLGDKEQEPSVPTRKRGPPQQRREAHTAPGACPSRSRQIRRDLRGKCHPATFPVAPLRGACTDSLLSSRTTCEELKCIKGHNRDSEKAAWGRPEMLLSRHRKTNPFKHWRRTGMDVSPEGAQPRRPPGRRESRPPRGTGSHPPGRSRLKGERTAGTVRENGGLGHRGRGAKRRVPRRLSAQSAKPLPGAPLKPPRAEPVPRRPPSLHVAAPRSTGLGDRGTPEPRRGVGRQWTQTARPARSRVRLVLAATRDAEGPGDTPDRGPGDGRTRGEQSGVAPAPVHAMPALREHSGDGCTAT